MKISHWPLVAGSVGLVVLGCLVGFLLMEAGYDGAELDSLGGS